MYVWISIRFDKHATFVKRRSGMKDARLWNADDATDLTEVILWLTDTQSWLFSLPLPTHSVSFDEFLLSFEIGIESKKLIKVQNAIQSHRFNTLANNDTVDPTV